jgi:hypothetical protein
MRPARAHKEEKGGGLGLGQVPGGGAGEGSWRPAMVGHDRGGRRGRACGVE